MYCCVEGMTILRRLIVVRTGLYSSDESTLPKSLHEALGFPCAMLVHSLCSYIGLEHVMALVWIWTSPKPLRIPNLLPFWQIGSIPHSVFWP